MDNNKSGIYRIYNKTNGTVYIGQAVNIRVRWLAHLRRLSLGSHVNPDLQKDFDIYGKDSFEWDVLLYCEPEWLTFWEQVTINIYRVYHTLYNIVLVIESPLGLGHAGSSGGKKGRVFSAEWHARLSQAKIGNTNTLGYKQSDETKALLSSQRKGVSKTPEHCANISKGLTGRIFSEETRKKMSDSAKKRSSNTWSKGRIPWNKGKKKGDNE